VRYLVDVVSLAALGLFFGTLGGGVGAPLSALVSATLLLGVFNVYYQQLIYSVGLVRGLLIGAMLGALAGALGVVIDWTIVDLGSGAAFGAVMGFCLGALVGFISRATDDENDSAAARLFLFVGSIFLGALLGAEVGLLVGLFLGAVAQSAWGSLLALVLGATVCGYLGSYTHEMRLVVGGMLVGVGLTAVSLFLPGPIGGLLLGATAGAFAPMLLVAVIGAVGGLLGRGPKAMVVEALEAPSDMLQQGAVPFLLPAMITGGIIGALAGGRGGLVVIPAVLALLAMGLGAVRDIDGRLGATITIRSLVETAMMGAEDWPVKRVVTAVAEANPRAILLNFLAGGALGFLGAALALLVVGAII